MEIIKIDNSTNEKILIMCAFFKKPETTQDALMLLIEKLWNVFLKRKEKQ